jgi:hypothetical protein
MMSVPLEGSISMNLLRLPLTLVLTISLLAIPVTGQKRRHPEKTPLKTPAAPAPAPPTFDTLLAADSFKVYAEVRGVGQVIQSSAATDVLEPVLKLGGPPKGFVAFVNWLKSHADQLTTSRLLVAAWPTIKDVPDVVVAIEFSSTEEAAKFEPQLNGVLPRILAPVTPSPESSEPGKDGEKPKSANEKPKEPPAPVPAYYLQRTGSLLLISSKPVELKKLRPAGSKLIAEDANFRVAYNRFASEPIFVYIDFNAIEKETEERRKEYAEQQKKFEAESKAQQQKEKAETEEAGEAGEEMELTEEVKAMESASPQPPPEEATAKEPTQAEVLGAALNEVRFSLFYGPPKLPAALGIGFSPENESFDLRALMIDPAGETSDPIPIFAGLKLAAPISPESPSVLPADSELVLTMSMDYGAIYERMTLMQAPAAFVSANSGDNTLRGVPSPGASLTTIEKVLKINVKDDLLPVLGSELAMSVPLSGFGSLFGLGFPTPKPPANTSDPKATPPPAPFVVVSLRDKEGMRRLMPKILEGFAGKAAAALAQTEKREDTEIVSFANAFAYAYVGNFLVLAGDAVTTRRVVDSYLKGETLATDSQFKISTRWQPRLIQTQVYISPAMTESYKDWANNPKAQIGDDTRAYVTRLTTTAQPITYSLSNDGLGVLHELHLPKNFVLLSIAGIASSENPPETVKNERLVMSKLWMIANAQRQYKEKTGQGYGSFEELMAAEVLPKDVIESSSYKLEMTLTAEGFQVTAVPVEYGKTGKLSFFIDQSGMVRAGDHGGAAATASDPPMYN